MHPPQVKSHRFIIGLAAVLLGVLAVLVKGGYLVGVDRSVSAWLFEIKTPVIDLVASNITFFGSSPWMIAIVVAMAVYWKKVNRLDQLKLFLQGWLTGLGIQILLRYSVAQWRPDTIALEFPLSLIGRYEYAGFPSGHVFRSSFLFGWWFQSLQLRKTDWASICAGLCIVMIVSVGLTRMYLDRHWMTDVIGSWLLATTMLTWITMRRTMHTQMATSVSDKVAG